MTVLKVVKVFIGSPGGLEPEREAAKRIVDEINHSHSEHWGCQIKLVGWEATLPGYSRAQSLINQDLDKCEYFAGVIWNHWGSRPDDGDSRYSSGFEEEFERATARVENKLMKDIVLFFKEIPEVQLNDPGTSVAKVMAFRDKCVDEHKLLFKQFSETVDFEGIFRAKIESIGWQESIEWNASPDENSDSGQPVKTDTQTPSLPVASDGLIGASSSSFVTEILQRPSDWEATSSYEIARLRLIAFSTYRPGNDEIYLGNHDANLIFAKRNDFEFSEQEKRALIDAGIAAFHHQNVPLWHWLGTSSRSSGYFERVEFLAAIGNSHEKSNALRILQSIGHSTPVIDEDIDRENVIRMWLLDNSTTQELDVALDFLRTNGSAEDLTIIERFLDDVDEKLENKVADTIVTMLASINLSDAFDKLIELNPEPLGKGTAAQLFAHPESIATETLERFLTLKSDIIRRNAVKILHSRQAIDTTTAERLLTDSDIEVRLAAVEILAKKGKALQEATIKKALIRPKAGGFLGLSIGPGNHSDDRFYERYQRNQLSQLNYEELRRKADECSVFDYLEISTLYQKFTGKNLAEIRHNLEDGFKNHFDGKVRKLAAEIGEDSKVVTEIPKLEGFLRKRLMSETLDTLCAYGDRADLDVVRKALDKDEMAYFSEPTLRFLGRFGDWSDKDRILSFTKKYSDDRTLPFAGVDERAKPVAAALYAIGKNRLIDLLRLDANIIVKRALIAKMSQKDIRSLGDDVIMAEINVKDDEFRKILALRCAQAMSQSRIRLLLAKYINQDGYRYYNSVHWLDLGGSMPRQVVKTVTKFELAKFD